ncbi:MAG: M48 family metallopeptidase [Spirochaetales bacterium]|nr:M48 family metallopeptidase [Spirochaetales bacterium]
MAQTLLIIYLLFFALRFLFHWILSVLNMNSALKQKDRVPDFAAPWIDEDRYSRARAYTKRKEEFGLVSFAVRSAVTLIILLSGFPGTLDLFITGLFSSPLVQGVAFIFLFSLITDLAGLPFEGYSQFVIEEEFGFNKMTGKLWLTDKIKENLLSLVIGFPLLALLFFFMDRTGELWWVYGWAFLSAFQLLMFLIYPSLIAPLFNKFTPLEEGELKDSLNELAEKCGFKTKGIFLMDGSRRSAHSNAYFTGLGRTKRIVLFDTLVESLSTAELTAVLAHEIGHYKKKHILKKLASSFLSSLALFYLLSLALNWTPLFQAFSFNAPSYHGVLIILMYFSSPFTYFLSPLLSRISRKQEYEADAYARNAMGSSKELREGLMKLNKENLSNLTPHPLYSSFYYSHPPLRERWDALAALDEE